MRHNCIGGETIEDLVKQVNELVDEIKSRWTPIDIGWRKPVKLEHVHPYILRPCSAELMERRKQHLRDLIQELKGELK